MKLSHKVRTAAVASLVAIGVAGSATPALAGTYAYRVATGSPCSVSIKDSAGKITTVKPGTAIFIVNAREAYVSKSCKSYSYPVSSGKVVTVYSGNWGPIPTSSGATITTR